MSDHDQDEKNEKNDQDSQGSGVSVLDSGGEGRVVVLIHGWPLSKESWSEQTDALKDAGYRVVSYDRRGFGKSDPGDGYDYDKLAGDLDNIMKDLDLTDATLVGFSMGGGEVARYVATYGEERLHSVVFASAVPPFMMKGDDNPDGPLSEEAAGEMRGGLEDDREAFFEDFAGQFYAVDGDLKVSEEQKQDWIRMAAQCDQEAAVECMVAFGTTDFRDDLTKVGVPTLVIHGDSDGTVPLEGSGRRTHEAIEGSELVVLEGAPHGCNVSHAAEFNKALIGFLGR